MPWTEDDRRYGRKVGYWRQVDWDGGTYPRGHWHETTAYLDDEIAPDVYVGTNKHSEEPVTVRWVDERDRYEEVST